MDKFKNIVRQMGLIGITNVLISLSGIILLPIITKNLPIEEYGLWVQITVTIGLIPGIVLLGLPYSMVRHLPSVNNKEEIQELFYTMLFSIIILGGVTSLAIYTNSKIISNWFSVDNIKNVKLLSLIIFIECINLLILNYYRGTRKIKKYSTISMLDVSLYIIFVCYFIINGQGILGALIGVFAKDLVILTINLVSIYKDIGYKTPEGLNIRKYLSFGIPTVPGNMASWIVNSSDRYVIGFLLGNAAIGYYSPGYSMGALIGIFIAPLNILLPSALSEYYDNKQLGDVTKILQYSLKYLICIGTPAIFGIAILEKPLLLMLSTPEIATAGKLISPVIAISYLCFGIYSIFQKTIILEKKTKIIGTLTTIAATLNIVLNFLLIPYFGIMGAAIATLISFICYMGLSGYYSHKFLKIKFDFIFFFKCLVSSTIMAKILTMSSPENLIDIGIIITSGVLTYVTILMLIKGFDKKEIEFMKKLFKI